MNDNKFIVHTPLYCVKCTNDRWEHVICGHPEMEEKEELVKNTLSEPDTIYKSFNANWANRHIFIKSIKNKKGKDRHTKVIVEKETVKSANLISAWIQRPVKEEEKGEVLYEKN